MGSKGASGSFERLAYEQGELWQPGVLGAEDEARVRALADHIPSDVRSVLDVGCGNGLFLHHLQTTNRAWSRLVGVDRSQAALRYVKTEHLEASIVDLPFRTGEFDLVSCLEVIEHLPHDAYLPGLAELGRVSSKYVLVCVPLKEDLKHSLSQCPECQTQFNVNYHLREYRDQTMRSLPLPKPFECIGVFPVGPRHELSRTTAAVLRVAKRFLSGPDPLPSYAVCPMCGFHPGSSGESVGRGVAQSEIAGRVKRSILRLAPRVATFRWIAALYSKSASAHQPTAP